MATAGSAATGPGPWVELAGAGPRAVAPTDADLIDRFVARKDERAFESIVERHGPMVLRVCRQALGDSAAADDAFQATFLVLAKRAGSLSKKDRLGAWLYGVAVRVAARARRCDLRRSVRERFVAERARLWEPEAAEAERAELAFLVHQEVGRLPERYRRAVLLCDLEGFTHEAAAAELGCPVGTVKGHLSRARDLLKRRLTRRGVTGVAGALAAASETARGASLPPELLARTARAGVSSSFDALAEGFITSAAGHLAAGAATMNATWIKALTLAGFVAVVGGGGALSAGGLGLGQEGAGAGGSATVAVEPVADGALGSGGGGDAPPLSTNQPAGDAALQAITPAEAAEAEDAKTAREMLAVVETLHEAGLVSLTRRLQAIDELTAANGSAETKAAAKEERTKLLEELLEATHQKISQGAAPASDYDLVTNWAASPGSTGFEGMGSGGMGGGPAGGMMGMMMASGAGGDAEPQSLPTSVPGNGQAVDNATIQKRVDAANAMLALVERRRREGKVGLDRYLLALKEAYLAELEPGLAREARLAALGRYRQRLVTLLGRIHKNAARGEGSAAAYSKVAQVLDLVTRTEKSVAGSPGASAGGLGSMLSMGGMAGGDAGGGRGMMGGRGGAADEGGAGAVLPGPMGSGGGGLKGGALEGGALGGGALGGRSLEGGALEGGALEGGALEGGAEGGGDLREMGAGVVGTDVVEGGALSNLSRSEPATTGGPRAEPGSAASARVVAIMNRPATLAFENDTPLDEVIAAVRTQTQGEGLPEGIPIYIDPIGLQQADRTEQSPVRIALAGVPLRTSLRLALKQLDLDFAVHDGLVIISEPTRLTDLIQELRDGEESFKSAGSENALPPVSVAPMGVGAMPPGGLSTLPETAPGGGSSALPSAAPGGPVPGSVSPIAPMGSVPPGAAAPGGMGGGAGGVPSGAIPNSVDAVGPGGLVPSNPLIRSEPPPAIPSGSIPTTVPTAATVPIDSGAVISDVPPVQPSGELIPRTSEPSESQKARNPLSAPPVVREIEDSPFEARRPQMEAPTDPQTAAILEAWSSPVSLEFGPETPLEDVLEGIKEATKSERLPDGVPIYLDPAGLQGSDVTPQSPVSITVKGVPMGTALRLVLRQVGLAPMICDGMVIVSSPEALIELSQTLKSKPTEAPPLTGGMGGRGGMLK